MATEAEIAEAAREFAKNMDYVATDAVIISEMGAKAEAARAVGDSLIAEIWQEQITNAAEHRKYAGQYKKNVIDPNFTPQEARKIAEMAKQHRAYESTLAEAKDFYETQATEAAQDKGRTDLTPQHGADRAAQEEATRMERAERPGARDRGRAEREIEPGKRPGIRR